MGRVPVVSHAESIGAPREWNREEVVMDANEVHGAIERGDAARLGALIAADPELAAVRDAGGVTPVMKALYHRRHELVATIRAVAPAPDVFEAAALGDEMVLATLLAAEPGLARAWSADGGTALHFAAFFAQPGCARRLLAAGADPSVHAAGFGNVAPLHSAVAARAPEIVTLLLDAGADPNARQSRAYTPLHGAAYHGLTDIARALLAHGADPTLLDDDGLDPAALAEKQGHPEFAAELRARR
ncbi:MAG: ankyrin repeat domain-containing protein [Candidatus Eisenbacteria bacterium]